MEQKDFSLKDFILSRPQQMAIAILLLCAILASFILILRRIKEERAFLNVRVVHSKSQFPISNFPSFHLLSQEFPISNFQSSGSQTPNSESQTLNHELKTQNLKLKTSTITKPSKKEPRIININKASLNELMHLPGIGPKIGEAIIKYRKEKGTFTSIEDIIKVKGIGLKKFEKCKDMIRVY